MPYDFMTLSPEDFEALTRDLLSRKWGVYIEAFKTGKDQGIDLRCANVEDGSGTIMTFAP